MERVVVQPRREVGRQPTEPSGGTSKHKSTLQHWPAGPAAASGDGDRGGAGLTRVGVCTVPERRKTTVRCGKGRVGGRLVERARAHVVLRLLSDTRGSHHYVRAVETDDGGPLEDWQERSARQAGQHWECVPQSRLVSLRQQGDAVSRREGPRTLYCVHWVTNHRGRRAGNQLRMAFEDR